MAMGRFWISPGVILKMGSLDAFAMLSFKILKFSNMSMKSRAKTSHLVLQHKNKTKLIFRPLSAQELLSVNSRKY